MLKVAKNTNGLLTFDDTELKKKAEEGGFQVTPDKLEIEFWKNEMEQEQGTIRTVPENYYVATIMSDGNLKFDNLESMTKNVDRDMVLKWFNEQQTQASLKKKAEQKEEWSNWETMIVADWLDTDSDIQEEVIETIRERGEGVEDENFGQEIAEFLKSLFDDRNPFTELNAPAVYSDLLEGATSEINWDELAEKFIMKASQTESTVEDSSIVQEEGE